MAIQFKKIRQYLARNTRLSICFEDGYYHDYLMISDIPAETINYWIGTESKRENIRLSLIAAVELAERDDINCIYFSLSREKQELLEMLNEKQRAIMNFVHIIDTPGLAVEDVLEKLTEQLETDGRRNFCVIIDELPLLSTREKVRSRIEENCVVLKKLNVFSSQYDGVEFVCNVLVSKHASSHKEALNELREYAPIEYFNGRLTFIE